MLPINQTHIHNNIIADYCLILDFDLFCGYLHLVNVNNYVSFKQNLSNLKIGRSKHWMMNKVLVFARVWFNPSLMIPEQNITNQATLSSPFRPILSYSVYQNKFRNEIFVNESECVGRPPSWSSFDLITELDCPISNWNFIKTNNILRVWGSFAFILCAAANSTPSHFGAIIQSITSKYTLYIYIS